VGLVSEVGSATTEVVVVWVLVLVLLLVLALLLCPLPRAMPTGLAKVGIRTARADSP
jgi:hypothetical protein